MVDRSQSPWTWASGAAHGPRAILDQFEAAQQIRDLFFRRGTSALEVRFHVTIAEVDAAAIRFELEVHGQHIEYRPPPRGLLTFWPGPQLIPGAAVTWDERYGAKPRQAFPGPWALFRLIDFAQQKPESDVRIELTFQLPGHFSRVILEPTNGSQSVLQSELAALPLRVLSVVMDSPLVARANPGDATWK